MIISLSYKDRKVIAGVAKVYTDMCQMQGGDEEQMTTFWRISMYAKIGMLKKQDVRDILVAMEAFDQARVANPQRDPSGEFDSLPQVIERLRAMMKRKNLSEKPTQAELDKYNKKMQAEMDKYNKKMKARQ